jgi:hypothetical protein
MSIHLSIESNDREDVVEAYCRACCLVGLTAASPGDALFECEFNTA